MKRLYRYISLITVLALLLTSMTVFANATELKTGIGIVTANSGLRLRAAADADSQVINTAASGDNVVIIGERGDWYLVDYNLDIGYMSAEYIETKERENVELGYGSINPSVTNMRSGPSTDDEIVTQASCGDKVFIFGFNCGWYKVKYDGEIGYIRSDLVTLTEVPYANHGGSNTYTESSDTSSDSDSDSDSDSYSDSYSDSSDSSDEESYSSDGSLGEQIAATAQKYIGCAYVFGGTSPSGFDCSGFAQYICGLYGIGIYRTADAQLNNGYSISYGDLQPGDLVFFANTYESSSAASHVGIYIGGGQFVHAANSYSGVKVSALSESYYSSRYVGARRVY